MAYKDKDKQREADKARQRRYRAWQASGGVTQDKAEGVTKGVTKQGVTKECAKPVTVYNKIVARRANVHAANEAAKGGTLAEAVAQIPKTSELAEAIQVKGMAEQGVTEAVARAECRCDKPAIGYLSSTGKVATKVATELPEKLPANFGQPDCECLHCRAVKALGFNCITINHGPYKTADKLGKNEFNRVALPGDCDYVGAC